MIPDARKGEFNSRVSDVRKRMAAAKSVSAVVEPIDWESYKETLDAGVVDALKKEYDSYKYSDNSATAAEEKELVQAQAEVMLADLTSHADAMAAQRLDAVSDMEDVLLNATDDMTSTDDVLARHPEYHRQIEEAIEEGEWDAGEFSVPDESTRRLELLSEHWDVSKMGKLDEATRKAFLEEMDAVDEDVARRVAESEAADAAREAAAASAAAVADFVAGRTNFASSGDAISTAGVSGVASDDASAVSTAKSLETGASGLKTAGEIARYAFDASEEWVSNNSASALSPLSDDELALRGESELWGLFRDAEAAGDDIRAITIADRISSLSESGILIEEPEWRAQEGTRLSESLNAMQQSLSEAYGKAALSSDESSSTDVQALQNAVDAAAAAGDYRRASYLMERILAVEGVKVGAFGKFLAGVREKAESTL